MTRTRTHKTARDSAVLALILLLIAASRNNAVADPPKVGIEKRIAWTTSKISGSPEKPHPYVSEHAFPAITFKNCLDLSNAPGSDRLFVAEQGGKIFSFPNRPDVKEADLVIDLAKSIKGVNALGNIRIRLLRRADDFRRRPRDSLLETDLRRLLRRAVS